MSLQEHKVSKNQNTTITNTKPSVIKETTTLQGYIANSMNGGMIKPIYNQRVFAGQRIDKLNLKANIKMATPLSPNFQKVTANCRIYYAPWSRVMKDYDKFIANKSDNTIFVEPNAAQAGIPIPDLVYLNGAIPEHIFLTNTDIWRDSYISSFYPRMREEFKDISSDVQTPRDIYFPPISVLPLRAFKAIYNDFERDKKYDTALKEYLDNECTMQEMESYLPFVLNNEDKIELFQRFNNTMLRAKRNNEYYTDYRIDLFGYKPGTFPSDITIENLYNLNYQQQALADARQSAENVNKNDWEIMSEMFGSRKLVEKRVNYLGEINIPINYEVVTQSAYNVNQEIQEEYQVLGTQGAVAYTECDIDIPIYNEFAENGIIIVNCTITSDAIYETGINRQLLNISNTDQYRPELINQIDDVLYSVETDTVTNLKTTSQDSTTAKLEVRGYKRKFTEYTNSLPNIINGDLTTLPIIQVRPNNDPNLSANFYFDADILTQHSYQMFELSDKVSYEDNVNPTLNNIGESTIVNKNIWKDYTDLLLNRKQAIKQAIEYCSKDNLPNSNLNYIRVLGNNQVYFMGLVTCVTSLPMPVDKIEQNETKWGEN